MARSPLLADPRAALRVWVLAVLVLCGVACGAGLLACADSLALRARLADRLVGSATFVVSGRMDGGVLETSDAAAARAREILGRLSGVARVRDLDASPMDPLVARLTHAPAVSPDAGPPRLLSAQVSGDPKVAIAGAAQALRAQGLEAAIDDHGLFSGPCERAPVAGVAAGAGLLLVGLVGFGLVAGLGARSGVRRGWDRLDLLARLGAEPGRLAGSAAWPFALAGAGAAVIGEATAWLAAGAGGRSSAGDPSLPLAGLAALIAAAASLASLLAARRAAARAIASLFR